MDGQLSEYELKRLENIRKNNEVLASLELGSVKVPASKFVKPKTLKRKANAVVEASPKREVLPRRSSLRIKGIQADSTLADKERLEEFQASEVRAASRRAHYARKVGVLELKDAIVNRGSDEEACNELANILKLAAAETCSPGKAEPVEDDEAKEVEKMHPTKVKQEGDDTKIKQPMSESCGSNKEGFQCKEEERSRPNLVDASVQKRLRQLALRHASSAVKVVPERIYCQAFHPSADQHLLAVGDKEGHLGFWKLNGLDEDQNEEDRDEKIASSIYAMKPHSRTISSLKFNPRDSNMLFTSSYDGSIRQLDLTAGKSIETYHDETADANAMDDAKLISSMDIAASDSETVWFSDILGRVGRRDLREPMSKTSLYNLSIKKIGCVSVSPNGSHIVTSSLDQTMKVWDVRKLKPETAEDDENDELQEPVWGYKHGLSVTAAYWSPDGTRIVSTSYDDRLRIFGLSGTQQNGNISFHNPIEIGHNNQSGRWVTMLRSVWHPNPAIPIIITGSMKKQIDIHHGVTGEPIVALYNHDTITAVPAVVCAHREHMMIAGGNARGKVVVFS